MKPWLRLTLIMMSVGGGFTGFALTFQVLQSGLSSHTEPPLNLLIMGIFLLLNAGVAASGLLFVHDPGCTRPLAASLAIQVPWISSSFLTYRFASGLELVLSATGPEKGEDFAFHFAWKCFIGSSWSFSISQEHPVGFGINLVAFALLIFLWRSARTLVPTTAGGPDLSRLGL
jgi:hypothetical protein